MVSMKIDGKPIDHVLEDVWDIVRFTELFVPAGVEFSCPRRRYLHIKPGQVVGFSKDNRVAMGRVLTVRLVEGDGLYYRVAIDTSQSALEEGA